MRHTTTVGGLIERGAEPKGEAASLAGRGKPRFAIVLRRRGYLSVRHRAIGPRPTGINRRPTVASSSGSALRLVIIDSLSRSEHHRPPEDQVVLRRTVIVREYERGLLYHHGRFVELLPPGRYRYWNWEDRQIDRVDIRESSQTVEGQEILTGDKIGVRVTLIAQYRVADPIAARHAVGDYQSQLYQDLQLTLREAITGRTLEELLKERDALSRDLHASVAPRAKNYGVELTRVGVKDMVLPGTVRAVFLQEVEADLKGRAALASARHEVAAARARVNTARLIQENPQLLRLQELETLAQLASKSGNVLIIPGMHALLPRSPDSGTSS